MGCAGPQGNQENHAKPPENYLCLGPFTPSTPNPLPPSAKGPKVNHD
eukprot:UN06004